MLTQITSLCVNDNVGRHHGRGHQGHPPGARDALGSAQGHRRVPQALRQCPRRVLRGCGFRRGRTGTGGRRGRQDGTLRVQLRRSRCAERLLHVPGDLGRSRGPGREGDRLKTLHRDVRGGRGGTGEFADVRYSALDPKLWNWIAVSGLFLVLNSFTPCTGTVLTEDEREVAYQQLLESFRALELPGKSAKLPVSYDAAVEYYDTMVRDELAANPFLRGVTENLTRLPPLPPTLVLPPAVRVALTPSWLVLRHWPDAS